MQRHAIKKGDTPVDKKDVGSAVSTRKSHISAVKMRKKQTNLIVINNFLDAFQQSDFCATIKKNRHKYTPP